MEFLDLTAQYKSIKKEIDQAVQGVLDSGGFILGKGVEEFEKELTDYCGVKYAIGVNSGTDALLLSLMALEIGPGDEVITTPFTFIATAEVIALRGAKPVFVDINSKTFNIDPAKIEPAITPKTKAIIPVHLYGQPADMPRIMAIAKKYGLYVIEDAAQAIGATISGFDGYRRISRIENNPRNPIQSASSANLMAGAIGDIGCLSFFPSKNLGAYGDGGAVLTNDQQSAEKIKMLRVHGSKKKYYHDLIGINSRLDALQAAILRVKLRHLDEWVSGRREKAQRYTFQLSKLTHLITPFIAENCQHVYHQYTLQVENREDLEKYLKENKIPSVVYYPVPLHLQPAFAYLGYKKGDLVETEKVSEKVLSLPIYPELPKKEQDLIIEQIKEFYSRTN